MQSETKSVLLVLTTIVLIVASSFAVLGYMANEAVLSRAKGPFAQAPDVRDVSSRATFLLTAGVCLWIGATASFARALQTPQPSLTKRYALSGLITAFAIMIVVSVLLLTMKVMGLS